MRRVLHTTPNLRTAILAYMLWSTSYNVIAPLLPLLTDHLGGDPIQVGLVATASLAGGAVLTFPLSYVSDHWGQRTALLIAWLLSGVGMLIMSAAHTVTALYPGAFLSGAVIAALPTLNVLVMREALPAERTRAYVAVYAAAPAGMLLGSWAGGLASQQFGLSAAAGLSGVLVLLSSLSLLSIRSSPAPAPAEGVPAPQAGRSGGRDQALVAIGAGIAYILVGMPANFVFLYLRGVGGVALGSAGAFASLLGGSQLIWSLLLLNLPHNDRQVRLPLIGVRLSRSNVLGLTITLAANALFGILLPLGSIVFWVMALLLRGSFYIQHSLGSALFSDVLEGERSPAMRMTGMTIPVGLGSVAAPVVGGLLYARAPAYPFWISGAACAVASIVALLMVLAPRRVPAPRPSSGR